MKVVVVEKPLLSKSLDDRRYIVIDAETGKILDDKNGVGYKTAQRAHAVWMKRIKVLNKNIR